MALDTPVDPFGATAQAAADLVPEARLIPGTGPLPPGKYGVTEAQVERWVAELSGAVAMKLTGWQGLSDVPVPPETTSDRDQLEAYARTVIENGAASYLEAARFPERASTNTTGSYAAVLWDRYKTGLDDLTAWLEGRLDSGAVVEPTPATGDDTGGLGYSFPEPYFVDRFGV